MNNLKFRAKANINNEWIYASNIHKVVLDDTNEELWVMHPKGEKIEHLGDGYIKYRPLVVDEETIGQYTCLKDINGVEIYEGDILECEPMMKSEKDKTIRYVRHNGIYFVAQVTGDFGNMLFDCVSIGVTVIGNIHENGELLK